MNKKLLEVGPLEMEVLGILNSQQESTVHDVLNHLKKLGHNLAYTTVMTVITRLYKKNLIDRRKENRHYVYFSLNKKESSSLSIFEKIKNSLFYGEKLRPILALLESEDSLTHQELEILKKTIEDRIKKTKKL